MTKAVFFDVDGTLLDTTEFILQAFEYTLRKYNITDKTRDDIIPYIGDDLADMYKMLAPGIIYEELRLTHNDFQIAHLELAKPFPNTKSTLQWIKAKGLSTAAITNRNANTVKETLDRTGIIEHIDLIVTKDDVIFEKPHPESLYKALDHFGVGKDETYMVGDSHVDILAGKNAGVMTVGVTYGFGGESIKENNPDYVINEISELIPLTVN